ncbi:AbgT transporter [Caballeronia hypogeia]|uniref:AbgT transporter n=1 Tax=Caballeronia hypogeia TaxID=1777140 RepID=A0A158AAX4_9BURK|nr:DUF3100 domain-containing protein [Caballeronia hypogeia]SAK54879.1 AbgT transporter [Caballeronia hypogeia]
MHNPIAATIVDSNPRRPFWALYGWATVVTVGASLIGTVTIDLGIGKVMLLPMVWAIIAGGALGLARRYLPPLLQLSDDLQHLAAAVLQPSLLLFVAKLGLMVGGSLPKLAASGWALVFQELGHFAGTVLLGLPLALMLGIKREAIGATFSVGREPSLAIIGERYGMASPEGRGVLAEYLTGTLFGAVFLTIFAGALTSLNIFDPKALAMGAGVGSSSMMASAAGAIAAQQTPDVAKDVLTFAAASNLLTITLGTFFTLFISLPIATTAYRYLEPVIGRTTSASDSNSSVDNVRDSLAMVRLTDLQKYVSWIVLGILTLATNQILHGTPLLNDVFGLALIFVIVGICEVASRFTGGKLPAVCTVSLLAMALTSPASPLAAQVIGVTNNLDFLAFAPPLLAFAGLSLAKDVPAFRRLGWRIVLVSFVANAGSFIGATLIAHFIGGH